MNSLIALFVQSVVNQFDLMRKNYCKVMAKAEKSPCVLSRLEALRELIILVSGDFLSIGSNRGRPLFDGAWLYVPDA
jgi:hypothetical protein